MKNISTILLAVILLLSTSTVSANPGIAVTVNPIIDTVKAGEIARYEVEVVTTPDVTDVENVHLFVDNPMPGWTYSFDVNDFNIGPDPDSRIAILEVSVSSGTAAGTYPQQVNASTTYQDIIGFETFDFTTYVNVTEIPEFPQIAMPIISVIGLVLIFQRSRGK